MFYYVKLLLLPQKGCTLETFVPSKNLGKLVHYEMKENRWDKTKTHIRNGLNNEIL